MTAHKKKETRSGRICVEGGDPGVWVLLERYNAGVDGLETYRKEKNLNIVAFTNKLPIARSTYYGWLGSRKPDPFRIIECFAIAAKL